MCVAYCNDPDDDLRRLHGLPAPSNVRLWQIGNETSYDPRGYDLETAAQRTRVFARAIRAVAPSVKDNRDQDRSVPG